MIFFASVSNSNNVGVTKNPHIYKTVYLLIKLLSKDNTDKHLNAHACTNNVNHGSKFQCAVQSSSLVLSKQR